MSWFMVDIFLFFFSKYFFSLLGHRFIKAACRCTRHPSTICTTVRGTLPSRWANADWHSGETSWSSATTGTGGAQPRRRLTEVSRARPRAAEGRPFLAFNSTRAPSLSTRSSFSDRTWTMLVEVRYFYLREMRFWNINPHLKAESRWIIRLLIRWMYSINTLFWVMDGIDFFFYCDTTPFWKFFWPPPPPPVGIA